MNWYKIYLLHFKFTIVIFKYTIIVEYFMPLDLSLTHIGPYKLEKPPIASRKHGRYDDPYVVAWKSSTQLENNPEVDISVKARLSPQQWKREAFIFERFPKHSHIPFYVESFKFDNAYIHVDEYVGDIDLLSLLRSKEISLQDLTLSLGGVILALDHCHENGIVHADVAGRNVRTSFEFQSMLIDFGFSSLIGYPVSPALLKEIGRGYQTCNWPTYITHSKSKFLTKFSPEMDQWGVLKIIDTYLGQIVRDSISPFYSQMIPSEDLTYLPLEHLVLNPDASLEARKILEIGKKMSKDFVSLENEISSGIQTTNLFDILEQFSQQFEEIELLLSP